MPGMMVRTAESSDSKNRLKGGAVLAEHRAGKRGKPRKYGHLPDDELMDRARSTADGRGSLSIKDMTMYRELKRRKLLEKTFARKTPGRKRKIHLNS